MHLVQTFDQLPETQIWRDCLKGIRHRDTGKDM